MNGFEQLKEEIAKMSIDDFIKNFVLDKGMKDYICSDIGFKTAKCYMTAEHDCVCCIRNHLESAVVK
jgi:hypothetical protein